MDGETLKVIGQALMYFFSVVTFITLLWLGRGYRQQCKKEMLREYGEEIYYANRLMRNAKRVSEIFSHEPEEGGSLPKRNMES